MGNSTIKAIFNSYVKLPEGVIYKWLVVYPAEKYESVGMMKFPINMESHKIQVPNHQPFIMTINLHFIMLLLLNLHVSLIYHRNLSQKKIPWSSFDSFQFHGEILTISQPDDKILTFFPCPNALFPTNAPGKPMVNPWSSSHISAHLRLVRVDPLPKEPQGLVEATHLEGRDASADGIHSGTCRRWEKLEMGTSILMVIQRWFNGY